MSEFKTPEFLENRNTEYWHERMKSILPPDLDVSEGGHAFNMTRPTALVAAELCEFVLPLVIQLIIPEWSSGEFLDGHAKGRGLTRRPAVAASGTITVTGTAESIIPAGSLFSTVSINEEPSVDYETMEEAKIPSSGSVDIPVQCTQGGAVGNAPANTVVMVAGKLDGIASVTNAKAITGGIEEESDDELIERITEYDKSQGDNYAGSPADYKRWATSVPGVGDATVVRAEDDSGTVTIILTDANGAPATDKLCTDVYNYIMRPDDNGERLAPVNASLSIVPPSTITIGIMATVELEDGATIEAVETEFLKQLSLYLPTAVADKEVRYTKVCSALSATAGVRDFTDLQFSAVVDGEAINGATNIPLTTAQLPVVDKKMMILLEGTV